MKLALDQARLAKKNGDLPFGSVVVLKRQVVGTGKCENNTTGDVTDHAEMNSLRNACRTLKRNNLSDCTIYCTNEPCPMCAGAIFQAKIAHIVIGLVRDDLPFLLRPRKILLKNLADDSGFDVKIETGIMSQDIMKEFEAFQLKT